MPIATLARSHVAASNTFLARLGRALSAYASPTPDASVGDDGPRRLLTAPVEGEGAERARAIAGNGLQWMNGFGSAGVTQVRTANPQEYTRTGATIRIQGFNAHPVVNACFRVIVDQVAQIPWVVKASPALDAKPVGPKHPLQQLLDNPGKGWTARQMRARVALDTVGYGNALLRLIRRAPLTGKPIGIRPLNVEGVQTVWVDEMGDAARWDVSDWNGFVLNLDVRDVLHFRDLDMPKPYAPDVFGYPRGAAAIQSMVADNEATQYVRQTVTNDGTPTLAIIGEPDLTQADALAMQERYVERMVNRGNRGKPAVFAGVKDLKSIGFTLHDLEFPDLRRVSREDICAAYGVDPRMIGIASASNDGGLSGAQYAEARSRLIQHTVEPLLALIVDQLNASLAPEYGYVVIDYDREVLRDLVEDDKATSERIRAEVQVPGLRSLESARAALRITDPKPTDTLLIPLGSQLVPVAAAVIDPTAFDVAGAGAETDADGGDDAGDAGDEPTDQPGGGEEAQRSLTRSQPGDDPRWQHWKRQIQLLDADEIPYAREARAQFRVEKRSVADAFVAVAGESPRSAAAVVPDAVRALAGDEWRAINDPNRLRALGTILRRYLPGGEYHEEWRRRFEALIGRTYRVGTQAEVVGMPTAGGGSVGLDFQLPNPYVERAVTGRAERLATYVGETTGRQITSVVLSAERAGLSVADTATLIQQAVFSEHISDVRAKTIARTEASGAMSQGQWDQARESGIYQSKAWLAFEDNETRETHRACHAQGRIGIGEAFAANRMQFPFEPGAPAGEVVNCRCRPIFYIEAPGEALL